MTLNEIKTSVFEGLRLSLVDSFMFLAIDFLKIKPEYHCTVNVAKELSTHKTYPDSPPTIVLEESRSRYLYSSHSSSIKLFGTAKTVDYSDYSRQRIDIALYNKDAAFCPIELKLFNPSKSRVIKDLKRNLQYLQIRGSSVRISIFACLFYYPTTKFSKSISKDKQRAKTKFEKIANAVVQGTKIHYTIVVKTLNKRLLSKGMFTQEQIENDTGDILYESFHFMAVIIILKK